MIKHKAAEMYQIVESARVAIRKAADLADHGDPEAAATASLAAAYAGDGYVRCARHNIQIHGGIGFPTEVDRQLHLRRALAGTHLVRSPSQHRDRLAGMYLEPALPLTGSDGEGGTPEPTPAG